MVDRATVMSRLSRIARSIERLKRLAEAPREDFLAPDSDLPAIAESHLRKSLEAVFDVGRHLLAKSGHAEFAQEYNSIASNLARLGIVPAHMESTLVKMAGYRNRLVHFYHEISDEELHSIVCHNLNDLREFVEAIKEYVDRL